MGNAKGGGGSAEGFLKVYQISLERLERIAEKGLSFESGERTPESLVSAIWFDQQLDHHHLRLADGRKLTILSPGRWNSGAGPDFSDARLRFSGGPIIEGDVEVHVFSSDWNRHRHARDPNYQRVILSVCLWNDIKRSGPQSPPILEMFPFLLDHQVLTAKEKSKYPFASLSMRGKCAALLDGASLDKALAFIGSAGEARIQAKASRMASLARAFGYDQTLYKGLMEAAGYAANKEPMSRLADVLHLELIREAISKQPLEKRQLGILSLMYGCSGFFEIENNKERPAYFHEMKDTWLELKKDRQFITIRGIRTGRVRPANNPYRRMAAIARLLGEISGLKLFDYFLSAMGKVDRLTPSATRSAGINLRNLLTGLSDPFWDFHLSAHGSRLDRPQKLIGAGLASIIVVNILVPLMLAFARQQQHWNLEVFLKELIARFGGQSHNALTRFTCGRILGPDKLQPSFATNSLLHQGLLQIYYDFCRHLRKECKGCDLVEFLVEKEF